jgi:hypothetical protein
VTPEPNFDELVGAEVEGDERERLLQAHELLVAAGPPPELSPELEAGPTLGTTFGRRRTRSWRRPALLAAALVALALAAFGGYVAGNNGGTTFATVHTLDMHGTTAAPAASGAIAIGRRSGPNWPMRIAASGLPPLRGKEYYEVWITRANKPPASCGRFRVRNGTVSTYLNAPYRLKRGAGWIVTKQADDEHELGPVVLTT